MPMRQAANLSLFVRLFPASFSAFVVAMLCVPSYLRMEPKHTLEPVGALCLFTSLSGLALLTHSITRSMAAYIISRRITNGLSQDISSQFIICGTERVNVVSGAEHLV